MRVRRSRFLYECVAVIALGLCLIGVMVSLAGRERGKSVIQLTSSETLQLIDEHLGAPTQYNFYKAGNRAANPQLRAAFLEGRTYEELRGESDSAHAAFWRRRPAREVVPLILGYTGTEEDADFLIEWLKDLSLEFQNDPKRTVTDEKDTLVSVFQGLGLMARRGVAPAQQFLSDFVRGELNEQISFGWYDLTMGLALSAYAFMEPEDLGTQIRAANWRAPVENHVKLREQFSMQAVRGCVRSVEVLESRPITKVDFDRFRMRAARRSRE